jgi:hypothetical protein
METDIDFYGNDIKHISSLTPAECCEECSKTPGCQAFTFVNDMPDGPWCYLKSSADGRTSKKGVVSGLRRQFSLRR